MLERFTKEAKAVVRDAEREARMLGSRTIEAEHLLLAASGRVGLDREELLEALDGELRAGLERAGVGLELPPPRPIGVAPKFGTSAKAALARSVKAAEHRHERRIGPRHIAMGVLRMELGTAARAVERAGIDTRALWFG